MEKALILKPKETLIIDNCNRISNFNKYDDLIIKYREAAGSYLFTIEQNGFYISLWTEKFEIVKQP